MVDYGYEEAIPDSEMYGYGHAIPDSEAQNHGQEADVDKYGYGDASADRRGDSRRRGSGDSRGGRFRRGKEGRTRKMGRRSSLKQQGAPRRSSIGYRGEITVNLPGKAQPIRRRTSITFHEFDEVKEVAPVRELAAKPEDLWFQDQEYSRIREKAIFLTNLASSKDANEFNNKLCTRGLESHINKDYVDAEQMVAWKSVFLEQYHQRKGGEFDDETVAKLYEMATMPSRARALQRAQGDFQDAEKHTRGVRRALRRHSLVM